MYKSKWRPLLFPLIIFTAILTFVCFGCSSKHKKEYTVGIDPTWHPVDFLENQGAVNAFINSLLVKSAAMEQMQISFVEGPIDTLLRALHAQKLDAIATTLEPTPLNQKKYTFSDPLLSLGAVLIVPIDSDVTKISELNGKIIAVAQFDNSILLAQENESSIIETYQSNGSILERLEKGEVDGVLMEAIPAEQLVRARFQKSAKIVTPPLSNEAIRLMTLYHKEHHLIKRINSALKALKQTDRYNALKQYLIRRESAVQRLSVVKD